jgi:hypothetical protein
MNKLLRIIFYWGNNGIVSIPSEPPCPFLF